MYFLDTRIDSNWENTNSMWNEENIATFAIRATTFDIADFRSINIRNIIE